MTAEYDHDWEDPRLAVEGFVTDYIVWRLAEEGLVWRDAPDVPEGAQTEHNAMRAMCQFFENKRGGELMELCEDLSAGPLHFVAYSEVIKEFGTNDTDIANEMSFGRMVGLIAFAGVLCAKKARENNRRDMGLIALYTSKFIDAAVRLTWIETNRSWAAFMDMHKRVIDTHTRPRAPPSLPSVPSASHTSSPYRRSSLLFVAAGVSIVGMGAFITHRMLKSH